MVLAMSIAVVALNESYLAITYDDVYLLLTNVTVICFFFALKNYFVTAFLLLFFLHSSLFDILCAFDEFYVGTLDTISITMDNV
jgi:hypothetical protein